jgi:hypothetical protein
MESSKKGIRTTSLVKLGARTLLVQTLYLSLFEIKFKAMKPE